jgi:hypothetical protein
MLVGLKDFLTQTSICKKSEQNCNNSHENGTENKIKIQNTSIYGTAKLRHNNVYFHIKIFQHLHNLLVLLSTSLIARVSDQYNIFIHHLLTNMPNKMA